MMKFAPVNIPLERRLQTFGVVILFLHPFVIFFASFAVIVCLPLYVAWYLYDINQDERGGRRWSWLRRRRFFQWARDFFPVKLVKTADLPADRNYIFAHHPHGIICISSIINFCTEATGFSESFPGIVPRLLTLRMVFFLPVFREIALLYGLCSASKESIEWILTKKGKGNAAILMVGGAQEALDAHKNADYVLTLNNRKGFVSQALEHGADLVPVFSFGENDLYRQLENPPGSWTRTFQEKFKQIMGFSSPFICGRGIFQYNYGLLPSRKQLTCVVGAPIRVEKVENPTEEQIDDLHSRYIEELSDLYEKHKGHYGNTHRKLIIV